MKANKDNGTWFAALRRFQVATDEEIKAAATTDIYFERTKEILEKEGFSDVRVTAEVTTGSLPRNWEWAVYAGLEESVSLLEGIPIDMTSFEEGTLFHPYDESGRRAPVMTLEGRYVDFCLYETPLLGLLCQGSGIATMAARVRRAAGDKTVLSFGVRRAHPALAPMIDRASYIGGFSAVSSLLGAKLLRLEPTGTMPHSLIITMGSQVKAWKSFDKYAPKGVPRIALVDTFFDEKTETLMAIEALRKKLDGVRLDTPSSRRGDMAEIVREVRWELDLRGYDSVKIFVSGGLDDQSVKRLSEAGADGFGVGTSVSNAPSVDFALDIVDVDGKPVAKRGKLGGRKQVWRCEDHLIDTVRPVGSPSPSCSKCGKRMKQMLTPVMSKGKALMPPPSVEKIRSRVLSQLARLGESD